MTFTIASTLSSLKTRAGHSSLATTQKYVHLAGVTFPEDAEALHRRMCGGESSTELSTTPSVSESTSGDLGVPKKR